MTRSAQFEKGLKVRRKVLGADYVDGSLAKADDFMMAFQEITTEWCWGYAWTRPGLDHKTRSMLNLAMLTALGNRETRPPAAVYCAIPAGLDAFKAAHETLKAEGALPDTK